MSIDKALNKTINDSVELIDQYKNKLHKIFADIKTMESFLKESSISSFQYKIDAFTILSFNGCRLLYIDGNHCGSQPLIECKADILVKMHKHLHPMLLTIIEEIKERLNKC